MRPTLTLERPRLYVSEADVTRRKFIVGGAALVGLLVAGCGSDEDGPPQSGAGGERRTRSVHTTLGTVELPVDPERVVAMYSTSMDIALVLELALIGGGGEGAAGAGFARYQPADRLRDVQKLATYPEVNFEQVAAARPDCILDDVSDDPARYEQLSAIAPTLNYTGVEPTTEQPSGWKASLQFVGAAFDKAVKADSVIAAYDRRAAAIKAKLGAVAGQTVAVVTPYDGQLFVHTSPDLFIESIVYGDLGFTLPEFARKLGEGGEDEVVLSAEQLEQVDAGWIIALAYPDETGEQDRSKLAEIVDSPLWANLPAVRADRVALIDAQLNFASPLTADALLTIAEKTFVR